MQKIIDWLKKNEGLIVIAAIVVLLRLPSLFEPPWYGDESIYLTIGQGIRKELVLYKTITDYPNKPPLIYFLAAIVGNVFWFRLVLLVWNFIHTLVIFWLVKMVFPLKKWLWYLLTLIFVLLTSLPIFEGNVANGEIFMIMPITVGMFWLWSKKPKTARRKIFWAGVMFGIGFLWKIPVAMDIAAAGLIFFVTDKEISIKNLGQLIKDKLIYFWLMGLVTPIVLALVIHTLQGVAPIDLVKIAVGSTKYVAGNTQTDWGQNLRLATLQSRLVLLTIITGWLWWGKKYLSREVIFGGVWFSFSLSGALISGRPYPHYLLQIVPPGIILLGIIIGTKKWVNKLVAGGLIILGIGAFLRFNFSTYPVMGYYENFGKFITKQIPVETYINHFDGRMARNYQVAMYLKSHTSELERVYVWGTEPDIYVLADRLPVGRLTTSFHVDDLQEYEKLGQELATALPPYIVMMTNEPRQFSQLSRILEEQYVKIIQFNEAVIFRRVTPVKVK